MSTPFTIITPQTVDDSNFVSSTLTEDDYPEYNAATTYSAGERVILTTGVHRIFESVADGNLGNAPQTTLGVHWLYVGPTNRWAAFDQAGGTLAAGTSPVEFVVTGDMITSIALLELVAASVRVRAYNAVEGTYYDKTYPLMDNSIVSNWYDYFFAPIRRQKQLVITDIPPISNSIYTITLSGDAEISLGTFVFGDRIELGFTHYGAKASIVDYSRKDVDEFGNTTLSKRKYSRRMDVNVRCDNGIVDAVGDILADLRSTLVLWVGAKNQFELLTIYGYYRDFVIDIEYATYSKATLQIEGMSS